MFVDELEQRTLFTQILSSPYAYVENRVLYVVGALGKDQMAVNVRNGVAKLTMNDVEGVYGGGDTVSRKTLKSLKGQVFRSVVVDLRAGDDVASITSDLPVTARGGSGNDHITLSARHSRLFGEAGNDTLISSPPLLSNQPEQATTKNVGRGTVPGETIDMIQPSHNVLEGNAGDDILQTRGGDDEVHGGAGRDTLVKLNSDIRVKRGVVDGITYIPESRIVFESRVGTFSAEAIGAPIESNPVLVLYNGGLKNGLRVFIDPIGPKKR